MTTPPSQPAAHAESASPKQPGLIFYSALLLSLPVLYLVVAVLLVPSQWAFRHNHNTYTANMGYGDQLRGAHCDILIYGDSSAMVGVDPSVLQQRTGMTACNIAEFQGVTTVEGTAMVDRFLRHNPAPRYLVFVFAPEDLAPRHNWEGPAPDDAIAYMMRTQRNWHTFWILLTHPKYTFDVLVSRSRIFFRDYRKPPLAWSAAHLRDAHNGWFPLPNGIATRCVPPMAPGPWQTQWANNLRTRYSTPQTQVLILTVPAAPCDDTYATYSGRVKGVTDNRLELYPLDLYSDDGRLHLLGPGVTRFSNEVADAVLAKEHASAK